MYYKIDISDMDKSGFSGRWDNEIIHEMLNRHSIVFTYYECGFYYIESGDIPQLVEQYGISVTSVPSHDRALCINKLLNVISEIQDEVSDPKMYTDPILDLIKKF